MDHRLTPLLGLFLGLLAVPASNLAAQEPAAPTTLPSSNVASQTPSFGEGDEDLEWMLEGLYLAADGIGMEPGDLFSALMHDLSIAEVSRAHGILPLDLFETAVSRKQSDILEDVIEEEIASEDAAEWRDAAAEDVAWMLYEKDPFGLADIAWLLDGAKHALDLDMLELAAWLDDGNSLADIALEFEMDPRVVSQAAEAYLDLELQTMLLLDDLEEEDSAEWRSWSLAWLPDLMEDDALFETLAEEAWMEEIVALVAEMLAVDPAKVWGHLEEGTTVYEMFEAYEVDFTQTSADFDLEPSVVREMVTELEAWLHDDEDEEYGEDRADF